MAAADILVTRAGPGTISEACAAGVPFILFNAINAINAIPAQEEGNVAVVVARGSAPGHRDRAGPRAW
jgi:1,2-diacylglycerol 3-beta-galactosyltransferase